MLHRAMLRYRVERLAFSVPFPAGLAPPMSTSNGFVIRRIGRPCARSDPSRKTAKAVFEITSDNESVERKRPADLTNACLGDKPGIERIVGSSGLEAHDSALLLKCAHTWVVGFNLNAARKVEGLVGVARVGAQNALQHLELVGRENHGVSWALQWMPCIGSRRYTKGVNLNRTHARAFPRHTSRKQDPF